MQDVSKDVIDFFMLWLLIQLLYKHIDVVCRYLNN